MGMGAVAEVVPAPMVYTRTSKARANSAASSGDSTPALLSPSVNKMMIWSPMVWLRSCERSASNRSTARPKASPMAVARSDSKAETSKPSTACATYSWSKVGGVTSSACVPNWTMESKSPRRPAMVVSPRTKRSTTSLTTSSRLRRTTESAKSKANMEPDRSMHNVMASPSPVTSRCSRTPRGPVSPNNRSSNASQPKHRGSHRVL